MKKNNFTNTVFIVFFLSTAVFAALFYLERKNVADLEKINMELKSDMEALKQKAGDNTADLDNSKKFSGLQSWDIKRLQKKGLKNPENDILAGLMKQTRLIKFEPQPGVSWRFDTNESIILSNRWVFTKFDEGHMLGSMLLSYTVNNGSITWEVISQVLD
jgi:hypothetical protein